MLIKSREELDALLEHCKVVPVGESKEGGSFYQIRSQEFLYPDGNPQTREYVHNKKASVVLPITEEGNYVFVVQPVSLSEEGSLIEFPAGYLEAGETALEAGIRELYEETGYVAREMIPLGPHYQNPGCFRNKVEFFLGLGCKKVGKQKLDKGEYVICVEVPPALVLDLLVNHYFLDANTACAFLDSFIYMYSKNKTNGDNHSDFVDFLKR